MSLEAAGYLLGLLDVQEPDAKETDETVDDAKPIEKGVEGLSVAEPAVDPDVPN